MATFAALNIEPDEESEEEIDDTKEIQIEEALKLYLAALKLHSQGEEYYPEAKESYNALFQSEIFKYPESLSRYKKAQLQGPEDDDIDALDEEDAVGTAAPREPRDATALPQTIYLSYKNHGQFILDSLKHSISSRDAHGSSDTTLSSRSALRAFAEALERDDTDLELWRKTARVGDAIRSYRIARFCLESVAGGSDEGPDGQFDQLSLEQAFAVEGLQGIIKDLDDKLSAAQLPFKRPRKALLRLLKAGIDPFPYLPSPSNEGGISSGPEKLLGPGPTHRVIKPKASNWAELGRAVLQALVDESSDETGNASTLEVSLPKKDDNVMVLIVQQKPKTEPKNDEPNETRDNEPVDTADVAKSPKDTTGISSPQNIEPQDTAMNDVPESSPAPVGGPQVEMPGEPEETTTAIVAEDVDTKPTRKRRSSLPTASYEPAEGGRTKSKRIRARESNADAMAQPEEISFDQARYFEDRLEPYAHADQWLFGTVGSILSKLEVEDLGSVDELKQVVVPTVQPQLSSELSTPKIEEAVVYEDLRHLIENWNDTKARLALYSDILAASEDGSGGMKDSALAVFLEHSRQASQPAIGSPTSMKDEGIVQFCEKINSGKYPPQDVALQWLEKHLVSIDSAADDSSVGLLTATSTYATEQWSESMKNVMSDIILKNDEFLYRGIIGFARKLEGDTLLCGSPADSGLKSRHFSTMELSQTLYELHLDIYASMTAPNSDIDETVAAVQRELLSRWRFVTQNLINQHMDIAEGDNSPTDIALRHLWSTTSHLNLTGEASQDHVILCLEDLNRILTCLGSPRITLVNSETMPEVSAAAVDKEVSRLKSKEFFMDIFGSNADDPVHLIESIEPILDPSAIQFEEPAECASDDTLMDVDSQGIHILAARAREMGEFLHRGDPTLRLFLWRRLQEAYDSIQYPTKSISCRLRIVEAVVEELGKPGYVDATRDQRQTLLLKWLRAVDKTLGQLVSQIQSDPEAAFECFDMGHLRTSMSAVARLLRLLHTFAILEDAVKVGQIQFPDVRPASAAKTLEQFKDRLRTMQVNAWLIQYFLLREGINQNKELFDAPLDDRIHYLRSVHNALGLRTYCKYSNKTLLKLMRDELLTLQTEDGYELDIAQVLFDLYGIRFSPNIDAQDHDCPMERLDRPTAMMVVDFVMLQANRPNIRDLSKCELKSTVDSVQRSIGPPAKSTPALAMNKRILSSYLKSPINPDLIFRSVRGVGELSMVPVSIDHAKLAEKGWYFLLGSTALAKYKSQQKRLGPVPTDDLDLAASFFKLELELGWGTWETWYRLAQVYDLKLEEDIAWSAEKLNSRRAELAMLQRKGIHSYAAAIAEAIRSADPTPENKRKISELYTDFGCRIYASSREPLSMEAFDVSDSARHFSSGESQLMYTGKPYSPLSPYSAWNFASYLLRRAMVDRPGHWANHYMYSKCLWKMFNSEERVNRSKRPIEVDDILDSLLDAIDSLPQKKEPILEPHFKFVSVVHKLVKRGLLEPKDASERLLATRWGKNLNPVDNMDSWKPFILTVLKKLQHADKANWHHRIVARTAHVIYDDVEDDASALAAKDEFTQHIFTKVMTMQIWRPENERGGRHFVYTTRYAYFFIQLLTQLKDRANLEMLIRRMKKKPHDFLNHVKLWEDICATYIKLFRQMENIPVGHEESIFKPITLNEFTPNATRLEAICHSSDIGATNSAIVDLLREAVDIKKFNGTMMKAGIFEDLIGDTYAVLYEKNKEKFAEQATEEENRERMKVDHVLMGGNETEGTGTQTPTAPGPKPRVKGVTRKELQKKAEAIALKGSVARQAAKAARVTDEPSHLLTLANNTTEEQAPAKDEAKGEASAVQSSLPGSVHDSADDESELSEIDEERLSEPVKPKPLFPNLIARRLAPSPKPSDVSTNVSVDGGDTESGPAASFQDPKSDPARPSDDGMDVDD